MKNISLFSLLFFFSLSHAEESLTFSINENQKVLKLRELGNDLNITIARFGAYEKFDAAYVDEIKKDTLALHDDLENALKLNILYSREWLYAFTKEVVSFKGKLLQGYIEHTVSAFLKILMIYSQGYENEMSTPQNDIFSNTLKAYPLLSNLTSLDNPLQKVLEKLSEDDIVHLGEKFNALFDKFLSKINN